jgi:PKD repeat protein
LSEGKIKEYKWDFGDKTAKASGNKPSHTYQKKGSYDVKLTVVGETGVQITTAAQTVTVQPKPSPPSVSLSVKPAEVNAGEKVTIEAKADSGSIKQGKLTVTFKVGTTSLKSHVFPEELDYDLEITRVYTVPENAASGKLVVTSVPTLVLSKDDAKKFKMDKFAGKSATASFKVIARKPEKKKSELEDLAEDPFVGTWAGIVKVIENSSMTLTEMRAEGTTTTWPLRFKITRAGRTYGVTGIRGLTIDKVARSGMTLTIHATGEYDRRYLEFDKEKFTLTLQQGGSVLAGKHRIDFAAPHGAPAEYRDYQIDEVKLHKQ